MRIISVVIIRMRRGRIGLGLLGRRGVDGAVDAAENIEGGDGSFADGYVLLFLVANMVAY